MQIWELAVVVMSSGTMSTAPDDMSAQPLVFTSLDGVLRYISCLQPELTTRGLTSVHVVQWRNASHGVGC